MTPEVFKILLIFANQEPWSSLAQKLAAYQRAWKLAKNAPMLQLDVEYRTITHVDLREDKRFANVWFDENISKVAKAKGYHAVCLVVPEKDAKKWKMQDGLRGFHYRDLDSIGEMCVIADEDTMHRYKDGSKINRFVKVLIHETSHMLSQHLGAKDNTHLWDYDHSNVMGAMAGYDWTQWNTLSARLRAAIRALSALLTPKPMPTPLTPEPASKLYQEAFNAIGRDASPKDVVNDEVACVESLVTIVRVLLITFPFITGTWSLWDILKNRADAKEIAVEAVLPGDIILSVTGTGNGAIYNGHTGVVGKDGKVMSNNSADGLWKENYTLASWEKYYRAKGGMKTHFYRLDV